MSDPTPTPTPAKRNKENIILGSGDLYFAEFTGTLPTEATICVDANKVGAIQGGASIEYKPTFYTAKDDSGKLTKTIITDEEATFKSGLMSKIGSMLSKICSTATETTDTTKRTVKIGGIGNYDGKSYVWCFHHTDEKDGDIWVMIVGKNTSGFTLSFTKDKETICDMEIKCEPQDDDGTLIKYIEEIAAASSSD